MQALSKPTRNVVSNLRQRLQHQFVKHPHFIHNKTDQVNSLFQNYHSENTHTFLDDIFGDDLALRQQAQNDLLDYAQNDNHNHDHNHNNNNNTTQCLLDQIFESYDGNIDILKRQKYQINDKLWANYKDKEYQWFDIDIATFLNLQLLNKQIPGWIVDMVFKLLHKLGECDGNVIKKILQCCPKNLADDTMLMAKHIKPALVMKMTITPSDTDTVASDNNANINPNSNDGNAIKKISKKTTTTMTFKSFDAAFASIPQIFETQLSNETGMKYLESLKGKIMQNDNFFKKVYHKSETSNLMSQAGCQKLFHRLMGYVCYGANERNPKIINAYSPGIIVKRTNKQNQSAFEYLYLEWVNQFQLNFPHLIQDKDDPNKHTIDDCIIDCSETYFDVTQKERIMSEKVTTCFPQATLQGLKLVKMTPNDENDNELICELNKDNTKPLRNWDLCQTQHDWFYDCCNVDFQSCIYETIARPSVKSMIETFKWSKVKRWTKPNGQFIVTTIADAFGKDYIDDIIEPMPSDLKHNFQIAPNVFCWGLNLFLDGFNATETQTQKDNVNQLGMRIMNGDSTEVCHIGLTWEGRGVAKLLAALDRQLLSMALDGVPMKIWNTETKQIENGWSFMYLTMMTQDRVARPETSLCAHVGGLNASQPRFVGYYEDCTGYGHWINRKHSPMCINQKKSDHSILGLKQVYETLKLDAYCQWDDAKRKLLAQRYGLSSDFFLKI